MKTTAPLALAALAALIPQIVVAHPNHKDPFIRGAVFGRVEDSAGKPVAGATVAILARTGKVISWGRTDAKGCYVLAANPKVALDIQPSRNRGLLRMCYLAAENVAMAPVKVIANVVANPGLTVANAGVSIASGTAAPLEAQALESQVPNHETAVQAQLATQGAVAAQALGVGPKFVDADTSTEGQANLLIEAPGCKKAVVKAGAYWVEPPTKEDGKAIGLQAWVNTVKLAADGAKGDAVVVSEAYSLCDASVTPTLVAAGSDVHICVKLTCPDEGNRPVRVFARECPRNQVVELLPGKIKDVYEGTMKLDRLSSLGDATICIAALREQPVDVKLNVNSSEALTRFVKRLEDMEAGKPYGYDPMVMASDNRADVKLTVLSPKMEAPLPTAKTS
jgi:hypothetical protein